MSLTSGVYFKGRETTEVLLVVTVRSNNHDGPVAAKVLPHGEAGTSFLLKHSSAAAGEDTTTTRKEPKQREKTGPVVLRGCSMFYEAYP